MGADTKIEYDIKNICIRLSGLIGETILFRDSDGGIVSTEVNSLKVNQNSSGIVVSIFTNYGKLDISSIDGFKELYLFSNNGDDAVLRCVFDAVKDIIPL